VLYVCTFVCVLCNLCWYCVVTLLLTELCRYFILLENYLICFYIRVLILRFWFFTPRLQTWCMQQQFCLSVCPFVPVNEDKRRPDWEQWHRWLILQRIFYRLIVAVVRVCCCCVYVQCESKSSLKTFCSIIRDKPVQLKIFAVVVQPHPYESTNFSPFIWTLTWIMSLLLVRYLSVNNSIQFITKFTTQITSYDITLNINC